MHDAREAPAAAEASDEALVARLQRGTDARAFAVLVRRHQGRVLANCRSISGSAADAHDLAQEVFVKVYFALAGFEGRSQFRSWLHRIKVNHCLNFVRKRRGRTFLADDTPELEANPEMQVQATAHRDVVARSERERIHAVLDAMPPTLRIPLILRDLDELSYQEVAEALGIGLSAAKMRIKRARADFRRRYEQARGRAQELEEPAHGG